MFFAMSVGDMMPVKQVGPDFYIHMQKSDNNIDFRAVLVKKDQKAARFSCLNFHERSPEDYFFNRIPMVVYTQIKGNNLIGKNNNYHSKSSAAK